MKQERGRRRTRGEGGEFLKDRSKINGNRHPALRLRVGLLAGRGAGMVQAGKVCLGGRWFSAQLDKDRRVGRQSPIGRYSDFPEET